MASCETTRACASARANAAGRAHLAQDVMRRDIRRVIGGNRSEQQPGC